MLGISYSKAHKKTVKPHATLSNLESFTSHAFLLVLTRGGRLKQSWRNRSQHHAADRVPFA